MRTYYVRVPLTGYVNVAVDAMSEKEAIAKALETEFQVSVEGNNNVEAGEGFSLLEEVTKGNVCYAPVTKVKVDYSEEIYAEDDES